MPVQKSCTPLTRKRMHAIDGQPRNGIAKQQRSSDDEHDQNHRNQEKKARP